MSSWTQLAVLVLCLLYMNTAWSSPVGEVVPGNQTEECFDGWEKFGSSCYYVSREKKSWDESRQDCKERGGDLVIVDNVEEQEFIVSLAKSKSEFLWIGLTDKDVEGKWLWVDGTPMTTSFWQPLDDSNTAQPDGGAGGKGDQDCVDVSPTSSQPVNRWGDNYCNDALYWLCERKTECFDGWKKFGSSCYYVSREKKSWDESRQDCKERGGDLVVVDNVEEQEFIVSLAKSKSEFLWIGLTDKDVEGKWLWVDGTPMTTSFWQPLDDSNTAQPDGGAGGKGDQDCVDVSPTSSQPVNRWGDNYCNDALYWLCERKTE